MVAQTKADVRNVADKPAAAGKKGAQQNVVDNKDLLEDQAVAAAVVDAEQSEAIAAQVAAEGSILPTEAPMQSVGEVAQAPAPTTTDTTTTATTPAPMAGESAGLSPWAIGGIALGGVAAIALVANAVDDDDDNPPAAPPPGPPGGGEPPPGDPANAAPVSESKTVDLAGDATTVPITYTDADGDALQSITIGEVMVNPLVSAEGDARQYWAVGGHGYEFVTEALTWDQAKLAAEARGGHLAVIESPEEMAFLQSVYNDLGGGAAGTFPVPGSADGLDGTWIGLNQAADQAAPGVGWTWIDTAATPFAGDSPLWNQDYGILPNDGGEVPGTVENNTNNVGAIYNGLNATDTSLIYDAPGSAALPKYLVEYDNPLALTVGGAPVTPGAPIAADQLATLSWNSMFNEGGSFTYTITPAAGTAQAETYTITMGTPPVAYDGGSSVSTLIEDQQLTVLA